MRIRHASVVAALVGVFLVCGIGAAEDKKYKSASLDGVTGLFRTWDAEALRKGELNFSVGFSHLNRDPGELVVKTLPLAFSIGLSDRVEAFVAYDAIKSIKAGSISINRPLPNNFPAPAATPLGVTSFTNEAPYIDDAASTGRGEFRAGAKVNLLSERRNAPFSMGLVGFISIPPNNSATGLREGLSGTGQVAGGYGFLFSKRAGRAAEFHFNTMLNYTQDGEINGQKISRLQNELWYRGGASIPTYGRLHAIAEIDGKTYFGSGQAGLNPSSPLDLILGLRYFPREWISVGAGYRATFNHVEKNAGQLLEPAGTNGFVAQLAAGTRRNDPPTVSCVVANASIKQDEKTTVRASAVDTDGDTLTYSWSASGGKVDGTGDTVTFDATGVAPGRYTVTATVSDGRHQVTCSTEITVIKKNLPPTVTCVPATATITQGESVSIRAEASDPNNDQLTYTWTINGQKIAADGPTVTFGSQGRAPGQYVVAVTVSDGEFTATSSSTITVREAVRPNQQPRIECLTTTLDVASGQTVELRVRASDPDNDRVTVTWSSSGGSVSGSGESGTFNAAGVRAGSYTVTATANDGRGGTASCSMTVNVSERITLASFGPNSARVDNAMKAMLDDLATRMQNDSRLRANVIGYKDGSKREGRRVGLQRAQNVVDYLVKKGVEVSRLTTTDGGDANPIGDIRTAAGRKQNRRVEIEVSVR